MLKLDNWGLGFRKRKESILTRIVYVEIPAGTISTTTPEQEVSKYALLSIQYSPILLIEIER